MATVQNEDSEDQKVMLDRLTIIAEAIEDLQKGETNFNQLLA